MDEGSFMDLEIEKNVIWNMIQNPDEIPATLEILTEKDFYDPLYRHAYLTILRLQKENRIVDLTSLYLEMGRPEMSRLISERDESLFGPVHHAQILKQRNIENDISMAEKDHDYDSIQERIKELKAIGRPASLDKIAELIERGEKRNEIIPTGYRDLDSIVYLERSDLMVLAGKPSVGKSLFGCSIMANMANYNSVGIISFEMSGIKIVKRLCYSFSTDYLNKINDNFLVASPSVFSLREVRKTLQEMVLKKGVKAVLIDYLQLMSETKEFRSRHLEISYIIRTLKELAKEFNVAMIVVSSLARGEKSGEAKPVLSDLKESGDIEYCSDVVCFLHRSKAELDADLIIAKNRNGKNGVVQLIWDSSRITYKNKDWTG